MKAQRCPVCNGTGKKPQSFYKPELATDWRSMPEKQVPCRACGGKGIVYVPD